MPRDKDGDHGPSWTADADGGAGGAGVGAGSARAPGGQAPAGGAGEGDTAVPAVGADVAAAVRSEVAKVSDALARLREMPWWRLPEMAMLEAAREVETALRSGFGVQVRIAGELDERGVDGLLGARSPAHLLAQTLHIGVGDAKGRIAAARAALPSDTVTGEVIDAPLPGLATAIDDGTISDEHARVITGCLNKIPEEVDDQTRSMCADLLLTEAAQRDPRRLRAVAEQIRLICDPDGTRPREDPADRAELHFGSVRSDGLASIQGLLDPLTMERLRTAVEDLARPTPVDEDTPDPRPAPLRRAHAINEVLRRYLACQSGPRDGGARPQIGITIRATDLAPEPRTPGDGPAADEVRAPGRGEASDGPAPGRGEASDGPAPGVRMRDERRPRIRVGTFDYGAPVSLATARMLGCDGDLIPLLLGSDDAVLDKGRAIRLFDRTQRRALTTRDKGCAFPGCDIPSPWCEAHHITYWSHGGPTDLDNGVLLCGRHHRGTRNVLLLIHGCKRSPRGSGVLPNLSRPHRFRGRSRPAA